jgi:bifunctional NMN adenylyltransferase/nudix hydrolase
MKNSQTGWRDNEVVCTYDLAIVIMRAQPCHNGHIQLLEQAFKVARNVAILIGSSDQPRTIENPFTFQERAKMIRAALYSRNITNFECFPLVDDPSDQAWVNNIHQALTFCPFEHNSICVVGHEKDATSYYLHMLGYPLIRADVTEVMNATDIRDIYFGKHMIPAGVIPNGTQTFLLGFQKTSEYEQLVEEYEYVKAYKQKFANLEFPPIFVTTDAVVLCSAHILLVKRRATPGRGLWALPGGFLNQTEFIEDGMIRELIEETRIKVPKDVLRSRIKDSKVFDQPRRSLRGRTITHAFMISLFDTKLPKVRGSDDAEKAKWFKFSDFKQMRAMCFEDHFHIGSYFISRA